MALRWYAASTEPRAEFLAASELERDGFEVFLPRVKVPHPHRGHIYTPLFLGYLFLRCNPDRDGWPSFRPGHRIVAWVNFGGEIPSLPDEMISALMERLETINSEGGLWRRFQTGEKVRVVSGGLNTLAEVLEEAKSPQGRTKVLLSFMGRLVQAQVPWESLRPAEAEAQRANQKAPRRTRGGGRWIRGFAPPPPPTLLVKSLDLG